MKKLFLLYIIYFLLIGTAFAHHDIIWTKTFGGTNSDGANDLIKTSDGGYAIAGFTFSYGAGNNDMYLVKTDADGNMLWEKTFGGTGWDYANALVQTDDGGYLLVGYTTSFGAIEKDIYLVKTDENGNELWHKTYGGEYSEAGRDISKTTDGGYIICGDSETGSSGENDAYILKIDALGNEEWSNLYGGTLPDWGNSIIQTDDGGYITAGCTYSFATGNMDFYVVKTDDQGNEEWSNNYSGGPYDLAKKIINSDDGGYYVAGHRDVANDMMSMQFYKITANGTVDWSKAISRGSRHEYCNDIISIEGGGIIACGTTKDIINMYNKLYLVELSSSGAYVWDKKYSAENINNGNAICMADDGSIIIAGQTNNESTGKFDAWLVKIEGSVTDVQDEKNVVGSKFELFQNNPNPFNPSTNIKFTLYDECNVVLEIFDINGRLTTTLLNGRRSAGAYSLNWNTSGQGLSSGIYFYKLTTDKQTITKKMMLLK